MNNIGKKVLVSSLTAFALMQSGALTSFAATANNPNQIDYSTKWIKYIGSTSYGATSEHVKEIPSKVMDGYKYTTHGIVTHDYHNEPCPVDANGNGNGYVNYQKPGTALVYVPAYNQEIYDMNGLYRMYRDAWKADGKFHVNTVKVSKEEGYYKAGDSIVRHGSIYDFFRGRYYQLDMDGNVQGVGLISRIAMNGKRYYFLVDDRAGSPTYGAYLDRIGDTYNGINIEYLVNPNDGYVYVGYLSDDTVDKICAMKGITRDNVPIVEHYKKGPNGEVESNHIREIPWGSAGYGDDLTSECIAFQAKDGYFYQNAGLEDSDPFDYLKFADDYERQLSGMLNTAQSGSLFGGNTVSSAY